MNQARMKFSREKHEHFIREQKTMPLVNHAFPPVTPAIFVVFMGSEQQRPCLTGWNANSSFSPFSSKKKKPFFGRGQRHGLPKALFFGSQNGIFTREP